MFRKLISIIFLVTACKFSNAQNSVATVYFMRSTGMSGIGAFSVFIDEALACHLNNNTYSVHTVSPGLHKFQVRVNGKKPKKRFRTLDLTLEEGLTYYISLDVTNHVFTGSLYLMEVTQNTAKKMLALLKEDKNCK